jgi:hypothetical protein
LDGDIIWGVDFFNCDSCGIIFCDAGPYESCEHCGAKYCAVCGKDPTIYNDKECEQCNAEETIDIPISEYDSLLHSEKVLSALEATGVDNWEGYSIAMATLEEDE